MDGLVEALHAQGCVRGGIVPVFPSLSRLVSFV